MVDAAAAGANGFVPMVLVERGQHGVGAGVPVVGLFLVGPALLLAGAFFEASVIFVMTTPSVSRPSTTPMVDAVAMGAEVAWPMVLVQSGQHGVGAGLPVVGWFSVGAFLPVAEEAETKASGNSVRRTQNSWGRFCGGWTAFVHWGVAGRTCGARVGFDVVVGMVLLACGFLWHVVFVFV